MTDQQMPATPEQCETEIRRLNRALEANGAELTELRMVWAEADRAYRKARVIALLNSDGKSSADREAEAHLKAEEEYGAMVIAKAAMTSAREIGHNLRVQLDGVRSVNTNARYSSGLSR